MTIKSWLPGTAEQLATAQQGILATLATGVSTTISQAAATALQTDLTLLTQTGAAQAVKILGGTDIAATGFGPCQPGDTQTIANHTGQNVTIYPPVGGNLKNAGTNIGTLIATGLTAFITYFGAGIYSMNAS